MRKQTRSVLKWYDRHRAYTDLYERRMLKTKYLTYSKYNHKVFNAYYVISIDLLTLQSLTQKNSAVFYLYQLA